MIATAQPAYGAPVTVRDTRMRAQRGSLGTWGILFLVFIVAVWTGAFAFGFTWSLTALTCAGFAAAIFGLFRPFVGVVGVGMLCALDSLSRVYLLTGGWLRWNTLNYWLLVVILLNARRLIAAPYPPLRILLILVLLLGIQLWPSNNRIDGLQHMAGLLSMLGLCAYFMRLRADPRVWVWLGILVGTVSGVGGFALFPLRGSLPYINENAYAYFPLSGMFGVCLGLRFAGSWLRARLALVLLAVVNGGWVFVSGSRGGSLVALCCMIYLFVSVRHASERIGVVVACLMTSWLAFSGLGEASEHAENKFSRLIDPQRTLAEKTSGRADLMLIGWKIFLKTPWGIGTGAFKGTASPFIMREVQSFAPGFEVQAHSAWIKTLAENGAQGFGLLLCFVCSFVVAGLHRRARGLLPLGLLVSVVLGVGFMSTEFQAKGLWLLAAGGTVLLYAPLAPRESLSRVLRRSSPPSINQRRFRT